MTPNKAIETVDRLKSNIYGDEDKLRWINELDGMVQRLVFQNKDIKEYSYPEDMDTELMIPAPFEDLYSLYLESKIDYYNHEYGSYNNSAIVFESRYSDYKKAYIRENMAKG